MASTFTWLDHSDEQRRKMMEVVGLFRERGTVDELGVGSVRDTLSETLFPGTSTLHTRARYLLFLPWIFLGIERDRVPSDRAQRRLRDDEIQLISALVRGGASDGVIGIDARERLKQVPSMMYWSALSRYGIRLLAASRGQYARALDGYYSRLRRVERTDDGEPLGGPVPRNWHAGLPAAPEGFLEETTFELRATDADYLTERILDRCERTYLAHLVVSSSPGESADFPWLSPSLADAPPGIRAAVEHARSFSEVMHGAALLYNLILSEKVREARGGSGEFALSGDPVDDYRAALDGWVELMAQRRDTHAAWGRPEFWDLITRGNPRVPRLTIRFVNDWIDLALSRPDAIPDDREARRLVANREIQVKGALARVANLRALERWQGASGVSQLAFRWPNVQRLVDDIVRGRQRSEEVSLAGA